MRFMKLSQLNTKHQVEKELHFLYPWNKPADKLSLEGHIAPTCWTKFVEENLQKNSFLEKCYLSKLSAKFLKRNVLYITVLLAHSQHYEKDLSKCNFFFEIDLAKDNNTACFGSSRCCVKIFLDSLPESFNCFTIVLIISLFFLLNTA